MTKSTLIQILRKTIVNKANSKAFTTHQSKGISPQNFNDCNKNQTAQVSTFDSLVQHGPHPIQKRSMSPTHRFRLIHKIKFNKIKKIKRKEKEEREIEKAVRFVHISREERLAHQ